MFKVTENAFFRWKLCCKAQQRISPVNGQPRERYKWFTVLYVSIVLSRNLCVVCCF